MPSTGATSLRVFLRVALLLSLTAGAGAAAHADAATYRRLAAEVSPENISETIRTLSSFGSRIAGYPGDAKAAAYVERRFREIGLEQVRSESFGVVVPVDRGSSITVNGRTKKLHALWPNLVRTSQLPPDGITGKLLYVGDGELSNFNGKDVEGSIVLVDFNSRAEWMNAPRLGVRAVIFIAPEETMRGEAEAKFISIPINIPRFWISQSDVPELLAATAHPTPPMATVKCDMPFERREAKNIFGMIPGTDPKLKDQIIVVQGYYDSISVVPSLAPGAESAGGIAALLEIARIYRQNPPGRTMWFVANSGHHLALQGVREFVHRHIDDWAQPSMSERAISAEYSTRTAIWLVGLLAVFALWLISRAIHARREGARVLNPGSAVLAVLVLAMMSLNAGFWLSDRTNPLRKPPTIYLWTGLDLTSQTRGVGIFYKGWFYDFREDIQGRFSDIARVCRENADKIGAALGFDSRKAFADGVNPVDGKNWRNFIPGKPAFASEVVTMAQGNGVTFASIDDARSLVDTPFDTPDRVNIANLAFQTRLLACLYYHIVTDTNEPGDVDAQRMPITEPSRWSRMALQGGFATVRGRVTLFDPKESFIAFPDPRLAESLVVIRNRTKSFMGVRGNMITAVSDNPVTGEKNAFEFHGVAPLTAFGGNAVTRLLAFHIDDRETVVDRATGERVPNQSLGEIDYAPDLGVTGARFMPLDVSVTTATKEVNIILFRCVPTAIFDLVDQQSLRALTTINILDGATNGEPRMFGYAIDPQDPWMVGSYVEDVAVIFSQPGSRLKILMGAGPAATRLLLINPDRENPEGIGYLVGGDPREAQDAELRGAVTVEEFDPTREIARGGAIYHTALHVAKDMWHLNDYRIQRLARYRIVNEGINALHERSRGSIENAQEAAATLDWERFHHESRAAWGFASRAYPDVKQTALDVVQGVLFYLALLIPFAFFMERLVFGSYDLKRQLGYAFVIFLLIFFIFSQVHPAFDITINPVIVLLAFIMLALSCIVIALIAGKFEEQLKQMNREVSGVHKADIGRVSVALAAFNLGISNMRRRKARTVLTCATLVLLTFTVLSFTSIVQTMRFNQVPAPGVPRYNGLMVRTAMWDPLQEPAYRLLADEYGRTNAVAPRAWFFGTQLGEQSFLTIRRADRQFDARALIGLTPQEERVTRPQEALIAGRWFQPGDIYAVIIPDAIAAALRVEPQEVGRATVTYAGVEYTVIGIYDTQKFKDITDLDNEILTPVDFIMMQRLARQGRAGGETGFREYTHLEPDAVFIIPFQTATNLGAELRSIAIDFGDPERVTATLEPLMHRLGLNLYAGRIPEEGRPTITRYSSIAATTGRGLELVIFPVVIAALIVLNTMLGSVFERVKEIHIFSSIGLAPAHIGMLFIAEAMVYAILGSVAGYLLGQLTSQILMITGAFQGLYLNYSSVSAVLTTLVVVGVVLLSTLYPARKAAEVATPAIDRTWRVPDPQGDEWAIPLPFSVTSEQAHGLNQFLAEWFSAYEEYSIGDFVTQDVRTSEFQAQPVALAAADGLAPEDMPEACTAYRIECMAWLAPFDLGVSQKVGIETLPTLMADVYEIRVIIHRESGDISNWKRVNRRFLNTLRKQFLIWRTLKQGERDRYLRSEDGAPVASAAPGGKMVPQPAE
ncbi:MAG TPA: FtsX-like permease family protein [Chthonomonadales bacterium]|nr:FtsX-like permease family protein [Chthonomonadales bacterium]